MQERVGDVGKPHSLADGSQGFGRERVVCDRSTRPASLERVVFLSAVICTVDSASCAVSRTELKKFGREDKASSTLA